MKDKFKMVYEKYYKMMYYISLKIINDEYLAEDAVQSMFMHIYDKGELDRYDNIESDDLKRYLAKSISNKSVDLYRKRQKDLCYEEEQINYVNDNNAKYTVEMSVEDAINCRELIDTLEQLPKIYYEVIIEHTIKGKACHVVARQAGVGTETIRKRVYRARKLLRKKLVELDKAEGF